MAKRRAAGPRIAAPLAGYRVVALARPSPAGNRNKRSLSIDTDILGELGYVPTEVRRLLSARAVRAAE